MHEQVHLQQIHPSHYTNEFSYLMSSTSEWTDEIDTGTSFNMMKIADLPPTKGNFHKYNHRVIYVTIIKNSQGSFRYKMGINCYRLTTNKDYTLCLEILNTDYKLWEKTQVFVDRYTSQGLKIGKTNVNRFSGTYLDANGKKKYMNYHRLIVNFRKKVFYSGNFYLDVLINIPQEGTDLIIFPRNFTGVYIIAFGIMGTVSNIDPDKVYDYHTAFDIKPLQK